MRSPAAGTRRSDSRGGSVLPLSAVGIPRLQAWEDVTGHCDLEIEIERLEKQRNLWKYGGIWLLVPMSVSVLLGLPARLYWVWFALCVLTYWIVRREAAGKIDPLLSRLKALHRELVEG